MDGEHTLERCREVTEEVLRTVFNQLYTQRVMLEGMILKPNMVLPGLTCPKQDIRGRGGRRHGEDVYGEPSPLPFRALHFCPAANPVNWLRPV